MAARAQQGERVQRIGVLMAFAESDLAGQLAFAAFQSSLAKLGWTEGSNLNRWLGLLKEIAPRTVRVALLFNPSTAVPIQFLMPSIQAAASSSAVQANTAPVHAKDEIEGVIAAQARDPGGGLIPMPDIFNTVNRDLIIALAARYSVPASYTENIFAKSGGLIAYGSVFGQIVPPGCRVHRSRPQRPSLPTFSCKRRPSSSC